MRILELVKNQSQNKIYILLYGIICFFGGALAFLYHGFYRSALLFFLLNLSLIIPISFFNIEVQQYPFILFLLGFLNCSYGISLLSYLEINKSIPKHKEIIIGFLPIINLLKNFPFLLLSLLVACYVYAIFNLIGLKNELIMNIILCSSFFTSLIFILWRSRK